MSEEYIKQFDSDFSSAPYDAIQTDGCFWRTLLHAPEIFTGKHLTLTELKYAFHYSLPDYMEDHRHPEEDRCYIQWLGHEQIIRIGFYILGERNVRISYPYRRDGDKQVLGHVHDIDKCNFFAAKCQLGPKRFHFYNSNMSAVEKWNPHTVISTKVVSIRGFKIEVLR